MPFSCREVTVEYRRCLPFRIASTALASLADVPVPLNRRIGGTPCGSAGTHAVTACVPAEPHGVPPILLFNGTGTSANDARAVEAILKGKHLRYSTVTSRQLNGMSESQLLAYRLMIVPG